MLSLPLRVEHAKTGLPGRVPRSFLLTSAVTLVAMCSGAGVALAEPNGYWNHGGSPPPGGYPSRDTACQGLFLQDGPMVGPTQQYDGCIPRSFTAARSGWHSSTWPFVSTPFHYGAEVWLVCNAGFERVAGRCEKEDLPTLTCSSNSGGNPVSSTKYPINILTGSKEFTIQDFATADESVDFTRYYRSKSYNGTGSTYYAPPRGLANWLFGFQIEVQIPPAYSGGNPYVVVLTPDGAGHRFKKETNGSLTPYRPSARPLPQTDYTLEMLDTWASNPAAAKTHWRLTDPDDNVWLLETFVDPNGEYRAARPTQMTARSGLVLTFAYDTSGALTTLSDNRGKSFSFTWATDGGWAQYITQIDLPGGDKLKYTYEKLYPLPHSEARLLTAEFVNASNTTLDKTTYDYGDALWPLFVTGVRDRDNTLRWVVTYDSYARATSSGAPGDVMKDTITYSAPGSSFSRTVTNALGKQATYNFARSNPLFDVRQTGVTGLASTNCPASSSSVTYNSTTKFVATTTDEEGRVTGYTRDARGQPTQIKEAQGTAKERVTDITWHSTARLPAQVTKPGLTTTVTFEVP